MRLDGRRTISGRCRGCVRPGDDDRLLAALAGRFLAGKLFFDLVALLTVRALELDHVLSLACCALLLPVDTTPGQLASGKRPTAPTGMSIGRFTSDTRSLGDARRTEACRGVNPNCTRFDKVIIREECEERKKGNRSRAGPVHS